MEKGGWVYILTNKPDGTLYIGVTSDLARRVYDHRRSAVDGFTKRYNLHRLVHLEHHETIELAIQRETRLKKWPRAWKVGLIVSHNPSGWIFTIPSAERDGPVKPGHDVCRVSWATIVRPDQEAPSRLASLPQR